MSRNSVFYLALLAMLGSGCAPSLDIRHSGKYQGILVPGVTRRQVISMLGEPAFSRPWRSGETVDYYRAEGKICQQRTSDEDVYMVAVMFTAGVSEIWAVPLELWEAIKASHGYSEIRVFYCGSVLRTHWVVPWDSRSQVWEEYGYPNEKTQQE